MKDDGIRLYSKQPRVPLDVVAEQHRVVHGYLEQWGAWNWDRYRPATCESVEGRFDPSSGREVKRPVISLPPNPRNMQINRAVLAMPLQHGETVKLYYIKRRDPAVICRLMVVRWQDFPKWMFDCRAMIENLMRAQRQS